MHDLLDALRTQQPEAAQAHAQSAQAIAMASLIGDGKLVA